jgi:hypothetical protein
MAFFSIQMVLTLPLCFNLYVINLDQTAAVPDRSILDNIHLLRNICDFVQEKKSAVFFASISRRPSTGSLMTFFLHVFKYGFGQDFISWVKILYTNIFSSVLVNGTLSDPFSVSRSVRQGCSLSPLLYVLSLELLAVSKK